MDRVLTILEVSRKQDCIFSGKRMRENVSRSEEIAYVTGSAFFRECAGELYERCDRDWGDCAASLHRFSEGIQTDFETAFRRTVQLLLASGLAPEPPVLPIRPIILAGDDVCFVTAGRIGLECARVFLEQLAALTNREDGKPYAACAGVVLVHRKYPFHRAYDLAEELCGSAKKFGALLDQEGRVSAMDWHVEFGQAQGGACRHPRGL